MNFRTEIVFSLGYVIVVATALTLIAVDAGVRTGDDERTVGTITFKYNEGQRKGDHEVVWHEMDASSPVYNGDTIRTAEQSEAILRLDNGAELRLDELSMVYVNHDPTGIELELQRGSVRLKSESNEGLRLRSGERSISLAKADAAISRRGDDVDLFVHSGSVRGSAGQDGGDTEIKAGQAAVLAGSGARVSESTLRPARPADGARLLRSAGKGKIEFAWDGREAQESIILEISTDSSFRAPRVRKTLRSDRHTLPLEPGLYYWRVRAPRTLAAPVAKFHLIAAPRVRLVRPARSAVIPAGDGRAKPVTLVWATGAADARHTLLLARDADFRAGLQRFATNSTRIATTLAPGRYFWRVETRLAAGPEPIKSDVASFTVGKSAPGALRLLEPAPGARLQLQKTGVLFRWSGGGDGAGYSLRIQREGDPNANPAIVRNPAAATERVILPGPGRYTWRVDLTGQVSGASAATGDSGHFEIIAPDLTLTALRPAAGERVRLRMPPELELRWNSNRRDVDFTLRLSRATPAGWRPVLTRTLRRTSFRLRDFRDLGPGRYSWQVSARVGDGTTVSTPPRVFTLESERPRAPANQTPDVFYVDQ